MRKKITYSFNWLSFSLFIFTNLLCVNIYSQYELHIYPPSEDTFHVYPRELYWMENRVMNKGLDSTLAHYNFYSYYYLSKDTTYDKDDISLGYDETRKQLAPGASFMTGTVLELRDSLPEGMYHLIQYTYLERNWNRNLRTEPLVKVIIPAKVYGDRVGEGVELMSMITLVEDSILAPGGNTLARSYTKNIGRTRTPEGKSFYTQYILLPYGQRDISQGIKIGAELFNIPMQGGENGIYMDEVLQIPDDLPEGRYHLYLTLDPNQAIDETNDNNNLQYYIDLTIRIPWWKRPLAIWIYVVVILSGCIWVFYNVRKRFLLRRELLKKQREAERMRELDTFKTRLYTNITHEFRTPLTLILGMADRLRDEDFIQGTQEYDTGLAIIKRNGGRLLQLINQLLDLAKLESNRIQLHYIQSDVIPFFRYLLESFHSYAQIKEIELHFETDRDELVLDFEPERLQQVISNLVSNAIKYTSAGGSVYMYVNLKKENTSHPELWIQVQDTGNGIAKEVLPYVFDRFYQVDTSSTRVGEGTGIGLALTKELVQLMDGEISVQSKIGEGSTFFICLPVKKDAKIENAGDNLDQLEKHTPVTPEHYLPFESTEMYDAISNNDSSSELPQVLIVEDNKDVSQYIFTCLVNSYNVSFAYDGEEGIQKAIETIPDLIISDVMMPKKDGFELCHTLKIDEKTSHIPIVLLTAKATLEDRITGLRRGADTYLSKPFQKEELLVILENLINIRKKLIERYSSNEPLSISEDASFQQEDSFLVKVKDIITQNLHKSEFTIQELADEVNMSRTQLHRKLKALTGKTSQLYVRSIRLMKAKELLSSGQFNVSEVAYEVGFTDPNYFSRAFDKEFGQRPSTFKQEQMDK